MTPSGYNNTDCWRTGSNVTRASRQSVGTETGLRGDTSRLRVGVMDRVDHQPQHLQFERERFERLALRLDRRAAREDQADALLAVARRLDQTASEVVQRLGTDPAVMLRERSDPLPHQVRRKQFGER